MSVKYFIICIDMLVLYRLLMFTSVPLKRKTFILYYGDKINLFSLNVDL